VHSEICRHLRPDSVVQNHVLTHVWGYVALDVIIKNGIPCSGTSRSFGRPLSPGHLYVCPKSGILRIAKRPHRIQTRKRLSRDENIQYHLVGGVWHEVRLRKLPPDFEDCWDALLNRRIGTLHRVELWKTYGLAAYALSARELTRREAKTLFSK
jgi:hypothetical protein